MIRNAAIIGLSATLLAACVPVPPKGPNPPPGQEPQAAATTPMEEPMEGKPLAPVDVRKLSCATLTGSTDDDKAYATSFLLGYRSALIHSRTIEIKRIEAVEIAALADCAGKPDALATKIFAAALLRIGPGGEIREPHRPRHREPGQGIPGQGMPGVAAPDQQPPAPTQGAPIQYTPAQAPPTQAPPTQTTPHEATPTPVMPLPTAPPQEPPTPAPPTQTAPPPEPPAPAPPPAPAEPPQPPPGTQPLPSSGEQK